MSFVPEGSNASGTIIAMIVMVLAALSVVIVPLCGFLIDITHDYNTLYYATVVAALLALVPLRKLHGLNRLKESRPPPPQA
jgi:low affinity Fe/Cu permease